MKNDLFGTHGDRRTVTLWWSPLHPRVRRAGEMVISVQGVGTSLRHTVALQRKQAQSSSMYVIILCQRIQ